MASIRKRGNSYLLVVSMGYDQYGKRRNQQQKTVRPPEGLTPKQTEKWLNEQAVLFEMTCKGKPQDTAKDMTFAEYTEIWLRDIAPNKLARSTVIREKKDIERFLPYLGQYKLSELRPEHFRKFYGELRRKKCESIGRPLSEHSIEAVHACMCGILSDAMGSGLIDHNPAWRTFRYSGLKSEKKIADEETIQKIVAALEEESMKYEVYYKIVIATGIRRGECCGIKWRDIDWNERSIHICRNVVKLSHEDIFVKEPKTKAGDRYVYFSPEMASLLHEYRRECEQETEFYDGRKLTDDDYLFRRKQEKLPMCPSTFTFQFKRILKKHGLPEDLNVHSLRHTNASLLIANGTDVTTVAGLLGHSQPSTTLDIYSHAFDKNKRAASMSLQDNLEI